MTTETKVLHVQQKTAKNGSKYQLVLMLVTINGVEFIRRFAVFSA